MSKFLFLVQGKKNIIIILMANNMNVMLFIILLAMEDLINQKQLKILFQF